MLQQFGKNVEKKLVILKMKSMFKEKLMKLVL